MHLKPQFLFGALLFAQMLQKYMFQIFGTMKNSCIFDLSITKRPEPQPGSQQTKERSDMTNNTNRIIVAFHIGRGGRYHNAGHCTFIGEKNLQDLITMNDANLFLRVRDENGRFCKAYITDSDGNTILSAEDSLKETGTLNFDNQYDTDTCCFLDECSEEELLLIKESTDWKSSRLEVELEKLLKK